VKTQTSPILEDLAFAEGLRWHDDRLWYSDMHAGEVHAWSHDSGDVVVAQFDGPISGLGWSSDDLLVVSMEDRRLLRVTIDGRVDIAAELGQASTSPLNDMVVDRKGAAYIGTFGFDFHAGAEFQTGVILLVEPDGRHRIVADDLWFPNGMVLTDNGSTLVVAETFAGRLTAYTVAADGSLSDRRVWAQLPSGVIPDGICIDADGAIWAASTTTAECVRVIEGGDVIERVSVGDRMAIACALGGPDGRTLYIASSAHLSPADTRQQRSSRIEATKVEIECH
jgi:sugar lactone lactonase YvrE